jgi:exodeoxyribonuclease V gamma subunit
VDHLDLWVRHLAIHLARPAALQPASVLVGEEETLHLGPVADPAGPLGDLIEIYWQGQTEPLPLFPETSMAFARHGWGHQVSTAWEGNPRDRRGERDSLEVRTAFRGREPLDPPFADLAARVFGPLLAAIREEAP